MRTPQRRLLPSHALVLTALSLLAVAAIRWDLLAWLRGPAPYPPEWQWGYRADGPARPLLAGAAIAAGLIALLPASASSWARARPRLAARSLLAVATLGGWCLQLALLEREPQGSLRALMGRAISPSIGSYHAVAVSEQGRDPLVFLREHAGLLPQLAQDRKHAATHPPGPVLWYRGALALCEASPGLRNALLGAAGAARGPSQTEQGRAVRAAALLGALGLTLLGVLALWPLALLAESLGLAPLAAARIALLWTLLPGPALLVPALDGALALPVVACVALVARAADLASWPRLLGTGGLAGTCAAVAFFGSYGAAPFLVIGTASAITAVSGDRARRIRALAASAVAAGAALVLSLGVPALLGQQALRSLWTALGIHAALFTAPRSHTLWLLFNPLDFALLLGLPVALAGAAKVVRALRCVIARAPLARPERFRLAAAGGLAVLLLLGVTRGEVGRLWIPLMPFALLGAVGDAPDRPGPGEAFAFGTGLALLTLVIGGYWIV